MHVVVHVVRPTLHVMYITIYIEGARGCSYKFCITMKDDYTAKGVKGNTKLFLNHGISNNTGGVFNKGGCSVAAALKRVTHSMFVD